MKSNIFFLCNLPDAFVHFVFVCIFVLVVHFLPDITLWLHIHCFVFLFCFVFFFFICFYADNTNMTFSCQPHTKMKISCWCIFLELNYVWMSLYCMSTSKCHFLFVWKFEILRLIFRSKLMSSLYNRCM